MYRIQRERKHGKIENRIIHLWPSDLSQWLAMSIVRGTLPTIELTSSIVNWLCHSKCWCWFTQQIQSTIIEEIDSTKTHNHTNKSMIFLFFLLLLHCCCWICSHLQMRQNHDQWPANTSNVSECDSDKCSINTNANIFANSTYLKCLFFSLILNWLHFDSIWKGIVPRLTHNYDFIHRIHLLMWNICVWNEIQSKSYCKAMSYGEKWCFVCFWKSEQK